MASNSSFLSMTPKLLRPHIPDFLNRRLMDLVEVSEAIAENDMPKIKFIAHKIRGNGATYGFPVLSELAGDMEQASEKLDVIRIKELTKKMFDVIKECELELVSEKIKL
jgi:HPt (histidine-containing phosphotransfer) domain-containing protein